MPRACTHASKSRASARPRAAHAPAGAEARLALLESLLGSLDLDVCARHALRWLARELGVTRSFCLVFDEQRKRLVSLAEHDVEAGDFWIDVSEEDGHPFLVSLAHREPTFFPATPRQPATPFGRTPFHALPLRSAHIRGPASGVLLVAWPESHLPGDVRWFGDVFGEQVARLQSRLFPREAHGPERLFLHSILDAVSDPILLTDPDGNLLLANARAERLFAAPDDASEGRRRAVTLNNMLFSSALAGANFASTPELRRELTLVDPDEGSDLLFELLTTATKDAGGGSGIVSVLRNITDLGRAAEEIKESYRELRTAREELVTERHRLDLIIDSVADPIVVTNAGGEVLLMNDPAERLFTVPEGHAHAAAQRIVRSNDVNFSSFVSNLFFSQAATRHGGELVLLDPLTGDALPFEAVAGKVITEQGELTAIVTTLHDRREAIERARLYEQVEQAKNELEGKVRAATAELAQQNELLRRQAIELEQASNLKSQFLANMSHELRTPLNAILGYTHMLLNKVYGEPTGPQTRSLERVDSNARHLLSIINEILDIARIESGKMPVHLEAVEIDGLVREVFQELEPIIARSRLAVSAEVPAMPPLQTDRQKVKQILVNLLGNALKFTHKGEIIVRAAHDARAERVRISVKDSGIGIEERDFPKIFEDFRQVDNSPTRPYGGTGLGLAICRRFAQMLGGRLTVESRVGKGSTFTLHLPVRVFRR